MVGADATVYVWFVRRILVNKSIHSSDDRIGCYEKNQIIFGTVYTVQYKGIPK